MAAGGADLSLLPLKPGDHLWRRLPGGEVWHALYVGKLVLSPSEDGAILSYSSAGDAEGVPQSVVAALRGPGAVARMPLAEFVGRSAAAARDAAAAAPAASPGAADAAGGSSGSGSGAPPAAESAQVRLYTRRPRSRREAVSRALSAIGARVDATALAGFPEMLPWWSIFDEDPRLQPGLCSTRARAVRYRLAPRGDAPVQPALLDAILAGGAVVRKGRVVLRGVRLMKVLRLTKAAAAGWTSLGGFVGQAIASAALDDGDAGTALATTAGGWAGGLGAAAAASAVGVEALGAGSVVGGLVVCSALSATGAVAGAGAAYVAKKALDQPSAGSDRGAEYHDCSLRLIGDADDVFHLFDATIEFPPEDAGCSDGARLEGEERFAAAGWYAVRVQPGASRPPGD